ncbi:MAG: hypothetical protein K0R41_3171, partial [Geminicoccaceae bacterium]|nr:hypothetical protein [Geminicoccaceae bacterium]
QDQDAGAGHPGRRAGRGPRRERAPGAAGRGRRAHPSRLGVRQRAHGRHVRQRHDGGGLRRHHERDRLREPESWREPARGPRRLARALRQPLRRRRRPYDRARSVPAGACRPQDARPRRGGDQLQAVHGLSERADGRRRGLLLRHARGGPARRRGLRPRRERLRDQHPGRGGGPRRQPRAEVPLHDAAAGARGRGDRARDHARRICRRAALRRPRDLPPGARGGRAGAAPLGPGPRRDLHPVPVPGPPGARAAGLRGCQVRVHAAPAQPGPPGGALAGRTTRRSSGRASGGATSPWSRPITARSASRSSPTG